MSGKELLTAAEAAERLRIEKRTLLKWARENKIESVKLSRKVVLFTADAVDDFVEGKSKKIEPIPVNHQEAGRRTASPIPKKKGGDKKSLGELWKDLRKEVKQWQ
ncbi:helix-turn-helix domain-containing protein [Desulfomonile tiedjei]|uniref:DNA-binding protein, excisionase family n=1 Tax=Desulfomonile tiedjei (strain ATCC 49306 / DSM 6799 / DCB-1) TaxID=706587 RepID=I4C967_DESTA|nr:helix-turn-helix domain-containing protein [Desulfomonile tiedjei]AFM26108.1 DNA-binding protein, excisionase family [Desulfomonile tiedjei DSM 6799]